MRDDVSDQDLISELRERMQNDSENLPKSALGYFDYLRWIQGSDHDVDAAFSHLKHHLRFVKIAKSGSQYFEPNPVYKKGIGFCLSTPYVFSKDNMLLFVEFIGQMDHIGMMRHKNTNWVDLFKFKVNEIERLSRIVRQRELETGKQSGVYLVWDMEGYMAGGSLSEMLTMSKAIRQVGDFYHHHQVELVKKVVVIKPPSIFHHLWTIVSPLLPKKYTQKLRVLSHHWQEELAKDFDEASELPTILGGTKAVDMDKTENFNRPVQMDLNDHFDVSTINPSAFKHFSVAAEKTLVVAFVKVTATTTNVSWTIFTNTACNFGIYMCEEGGANDGGANRVHPFHDEGGAHDDLANQVDRPNHGGVLNDDGANRTNPLIEKGGVKNGGAKWIYPEIRSLPASQICPEMDRLELNQPGEYKMLFSNPSHYNLFGKLHVKICITVGGTERIEPMFDVLLTKEFDAILL